MEKPNIKDFKYENVEFKDIVAYVERLEEYNLYLENKLSKLSQHDVMLTFADLEDGILKHKAKSEYKQASIIIVRDVFKANAT